MKLFFFAVLIVSVAGAAFGQTDIREVDFRNFTYRPLCTGAKPQPVPVKNSEYSKEVKRDGYIDRFYFKVTDVLYGDLNADGKDEAVVLTFCNTGGTGNFSEGFIYSISAAKPVLLTRIPGGDRAYGGLRSAKIAARVLTIERNDAGPFGGACCPEYVVTKRYKLSAGKLVEFGRASRRELYPKERLTFAAGTSGKSFTVTIAPQDIKRYTLAARAGQLLSVSAGTDKASVRLLDDALVTEGENGFTAKLPKNGDYTFEVQNATEAAIAVTITVNVR